MKFYYIFFYKIFSKSTEPIKHYTVTNTPKIPLKIYTINENGKEKYLNKNFQLKSKEYTFDAELKSSHEMYKLAYGIEVSKKNAKNIKNMIEKNNKSNQSIQNKEDEKSEGNDETKDKIDLNIKNNVINITLNFLDNRYLIKLSDDICLRKNKNIVVPTSCPEYTDNNTVKIDEEYLFYAEINNERPFLNEKVSSTKKSRDVKDIDNDTENLETIKKLKKDKYHDNGSIEDDITVIELNTSSDFEKLSSIKGTNLEKISEIFDNMSVSSSKDEIKKNEKNVGTPLPDIRENDKSLTDTIEKLLQFDTKKPMLEDKNGYDILNPKEKPNDPTLSSAFPPVMRKNPNNINSQINPNPSNENNNTGLDHKTSLNNTNNSNYKNAPIQDTSNTEKLDKVQHPNQNMEKQSITENLPDNNIQPAQSNGINSTQTNNNINTQSNSNSGKQNMNELSNKPKDSNDINKNGKTNTDNKENNDVILNLAKTTNILAETLSEKESKNNKPKKDKKSPLGMFSKIPTPAGAAANALGSIF